MADAADREVNEKQVQDVIETLMHEDNLPKSERIRLMKELVRKGEELPDEALEIALKRLLERILF